MTGERILYFRATYSFILTPVPFWKKKNWLEFFFFFNTGARPGFPDVSMSRSVHATLTPAFIAMFMIELATGY